MVTDAGVRAFTPTTEMADCMSHTYRQHTLCSHRFYLGIFFMFVHYKWMLKLNVDWILAESVNTSKVISELPLERPLRLQGACGPTDIFPSWLSGDVSEIKELWWKNIILQCTCGFLSVATFLIQWYSYLFSFANIPLLFALLFNDNVTTQKSSNIPKYANTQACLTV